MDNSIKTVKDIAYGSMAPQKLDLYLPDSAQFTTIVCFHGGGLESGDKADPSFVDMAGSFTRAGYGFASCNYRMYPKYRFPDFVRDAARAVAYVKKHVAEYGGNGDVVVYGQSAGGWLSLMLCVNEEYLHAEGIEPLDISGWIIDSAQPTSHFNILNREYKLDTLAQRIDRRAPLYYVSSSTRFSRMLIVFYADDMPCRAEQNLLFCRTVKCYYNDADLTALQLDGGHCAGSCIKDDDGEYPIVKLSLDWLRRSVAPTEAANA